MKKQDQKLALKTDKVVSLSKIQAKAVKGAAPSSYICAVTTSRFC